jgi:hypothetical protein
MISDTQMAYGSRVARHGKQRPLARYQPSKSGAKSYVESFIIAQKLIICAKIHLKIGLKQIFRENNSKNISSCHKKVIYLQTKKLRIV